MTDLFKAGLTGAAVGSVALASYALVKSSSVTKLISEAIESGKIETVQGPTGPRGPEGPPGKDGNDGDDGEDGLHGHSGASVSSVGDILYFTHIPPFPRYIRANGLKVYTANYRELAEFLGVEEGNVNFQLPDHEDLFIASKESTPEDSSVEVREVLSELSLGPGLSYNSASQVLTIAGPQKRSCLYPSLSYSTAYGNKHSYSGRIIRMMTLQEVQYYHPELCEQGLVTGHTCDWTRVFPIDPIIKPGIFFIPMMVKDQPLLIEVSYDPHHASLSNNSWYGGHCGNMDCSLNLTVVSDLSKELPPSSQPLINITSKLYDLLHGQETTMKAYVDTGKD